MPFDPDAFLGGKPAAQTGFDPDAFISSSAPSDETIRIGRYTTSTKVADTGDAVLVGMSDQDRKAFEAAKPGETFTINGAKATKVNDTDFEQEQKKWTNADEAGQMFKAFSTAMAESAAPAGAGMAGASAVGRLWKLGENASKLAKVGKSASQVGAALVGAGGAGYVQDKALTVALPEVMADVHNAQAQHPNATLLGGLAGQSPMQGLGGTLAQRATGAGIGAGIQGIQELISGGDEDSGLRVLLAGGGGAMFGKATKTGEAFEVLGEKAADRITSRLGNVKAGDPLPVITQKANEVTNLPRVPSAEQHAMALEGDFSRFQPPELKAPIELDDAALQSKLLSQELAQRLITARQDAGLPPGTVPEGSVLEQKSGSGRAKPRLEGVEPLPPERNPLSLRESTYGQKVEGLEPGAEGTGIVKTGKKPSLGPAEPGPSRVRGLGPEQPARDTLLTELAQAGETLPATARVESEQGLRKSTGLEGFAPVEPKATMEFEQPGRAARPMESETTAFNERVKRVTENLANEGVELPRETAVKLARITDVAEFNAARQQLIDSVNPKVPEIPKAGPAVVERIKNEPIKDLSKLPEKVGQDDAVISETPEVQKPIASEPVKSPEVGGKKMKGDYERYQEVQKEWADLIKQGKGEGPEVQKLWAENEEIKNRHGGMPPEAPVAPKPEVAASPEAAPVPAPEPVKPVVAAEPAPAPKPVEKPANKAKVKAETVVTPEKVESPLLETAKAKPVAQPEPAAPAQVEAPVETASVKAGKGTVEIQKRADGAWYGPDGTKLSDGSRQYAIDQLKKNMKGAKPAKKAALDDEAAIEAAAKAQQKGVSGGKMTSESGSVANPLKPAAEAVERGVNKLNDALLERMAQADVEATNPRLRAERLFQEYTPENGESPDRITPQEGELLPVVDENGRELPENIKANERIVYENLKKQAAFQGNPEPVREVQEAIAQVPEEYVPGLTDLAARIPMLDNPVGHIITKPVGAFAKVVKKWAGLVEGNIKDVSKRVYGKLRERDHYIGTLATRLMNETGEFGTLARQGLSKENFLELELAALTGDRGLITDVISRADNKDKLLAAFERNQAAKAAARQMLIESGRDVGEVEAYFRRIVTDKEGLLKALGKKPGEWDQAIRRATKDKGSALTEAEKVKLMNDMVVGTLRGRSGPAFLKNRSVGTITKDLLKFYEPFDVADARWAMQVANDLGNRKFFGKVRPDVSEAGATTPKAYTDDSSFGKAILEEVRKGAIQDRGLKIIEENLQDLFNGATRRFSDTEHIAATARKLQTYAYLSDVGTALIQFADIFSVMREYGISATAKGYFGRNKARIEDLGVIEGHNQDLAEFSRQAKSPVGKALEYLPRMAMKHLLGWADGFQKNATVKAANDAISAMAHEGGDGWKKIEGDYSKMFPERWPDMKKGLMSKDFAQGKLDENTSLFLFSELARLQPITAAGRAQRYQTANNVVKMMYSLRSYWLKQADIMRDQAYNAIKRGNWADGGARALTYLTLVVAGQQLFQAGKDKMLGRDLTPEEYAVGGLLQFVGVPRYTIYRQKQVGTGTAMMETAFPGLGILNDMGRDVASTAKFISGTRDKEGSLVVPDLGSLVGQSEALKYTPGIGRELYAHFGKGQTKDIKERQRLLNGGKPRPTALQEIANFFDPPDADLTGGNP